MSINISENQNYIRGNYGYHRAGQDSRGNQETGKSVFQRDSLEISAENVETIRERMEHTVIQSVTSLSDMKAGILKEIREEKGHYDHKDVVCMWVKLYEALF